MRGALPPKPGVQKIRISSYKHLSSTLRRRKKVIAHPNAQYLFTKAKALIAQTTGAQ
jgi:hypothetical protein